MSKKDDKEMLSFEELREKLGMNGNSDNALSDKIDFSELESTDSKSADISSKTTGFASDNIAAQIEKRLNAEAPTEENNEADANFIDITKQYVDKDAADKAPQPVQYIKKKKKVRTFNEIFSDFFKGIVPLKKDSTKEKIRKIVMDISVIAIICCAVAFGELYRQHRVQLQTEENIKGLLVNTDEMDQNEYNEAWEDIFAKYPNISVPDGMNLKYAYLYAVNQDLVGWLKIPNTNLDVQVVQSNDNEEYLKKDFYGKKSRYGCPYLDERNDAKYLNDNTIIYGHHMPDGLMFSNLDKYKTLEGYKESPIIQYDTLYQTYYFKVFAAFISNAEEAEDDGYIFNYTVPKFDGDQKFNSFIENVKKRSIFDSGVTVQPDDKLITLVTCSYEFNEARLVVMGRMVRENEDITVDTSAAALNTSPKYPQAWYEAKGLENPYRNDEKWMP